MCNKYLNNIYKTIYYKRVLFLLDLVQATTKITYKEAKKYVTKYLKATTFFTAYFWAL